MGLGWIWDWLFPEARWHPGVTVPKCLPGSFPGLFPNVFCRRGPRGLFLLPHFSVASGFSSLGYQCFRISSALSAGCHCLGPGFNDTVGFPGGSVVKNPPASAGEDSILESGRSPGGGNGNPFQYSCLGNSMDRGAWWATVHGVTKESTGLNA